MVELRSVLVTGGPTGEAADTPGEGTTLVFRVVLCNLMWCD